MTGDIKERALSFLYRQLKKARIALGRAEENGDAEAMANLQNKIDVLEWLTEITLKAEGGANG